MSRVTQIAKQIPVQMFGRYNEPAPVSREEIKRKGANPPGAGRRWKDAANYARTRPVWLAAVGTTAFLGFVAQMNERANPILYEEWTEGPADGFTQAVGNNGVADTLQERGINDVGFATIAGMALGTLTARWLIQANLVNRKQSARSVKWWGRIGAVVGGLASVGISRFVGELPGHGYGFVPNNEDVNRYNLFAGVVGGFVAATAIDAHQIRVAPEPPRPQYPNAAGRAPIDLPPIPSLGVRGAYISGEDPIVPPPTVLEASDGTRHLNVRF